MKDLSKFVYEANGKRLVNKKLVKKYASKLTLDFLIKNRKGKKKSIHESRIFESMKGDKYIDVEALEKDLNELFTKTIDNWGSKYKDTFYDYVDEYAYAITESIAKDMDKYVHMSDHNMMGNFANIEYDYEREHEGKKFEDIIKKIDSGVEDEDTKEFKTWSIGWFFNAFGTWGLTYNFQDFLGELEYEFEQEDKED